MLLPEIIGIGGSHGSGKDTLAALRAERKNAQHVSLSDILRQQLVIDGITLERENLIALSRKWRIESGDNGILATKTIRHYLGDKALHNYDGLSIVSVRHPDEAKVIKRFGGHILWVDADPELRYERISSSQRDRIDDRKTFEEFLAEEEQESITKHETDPSRVNLRAVASYADHIVINNFPTEKEYRAHLEDRFNL